MNLWTRLTAFFRLPLLPPPLPPPPPAAGRTFTFDLEVQHSLQLLAEQEQRTPQEVAAHLMRAALQSRQLNTQSWRRWHALSPREQQIAALVCLNYTSRQMAARLGISPETIKTHVSSILKKFEAGSRQELRQLLASWDFSAWE